MRTLWIGLASLLGILFPLVALGADESKEVAKFTVRVTPVAAKEAKEFPELELVNGNRAMRLERKDHGRTVELPLQAYIILHFPAEEGVKGYTVTPSHGVLESPRGIFHLPQDVIGVLHAVNAGTATITVKELAPKKVNSRPGEKVAAGRTVNNWSGYSLMTGGPFSYVSGRWTVPIVTGDGGNSSSTWVGIDGDGSSTVIQTGTDQNWSCDWFGNCGAQYSAWYELFPADPVTIPHPVMPGDRMEAAINFAGGNFSPGSPMTWVIYLRDNTANWTYSTPVTYSGLLSSAEWIEEAATSCDIFGNNCSVLPLADYGSVTFDVGDAVAPKGVPGFTPAESIAIVQTASATGGNPLFSTPSNPDADRDGFTVAFGISTPSPPGPFITTTSLPNAVLNQQYQQTLHVSGDPSPWWSLVGGRLPSGLTFDGPSGSISGIPTASGSFSFSVIAGDSSNPGAFSQVQPLTLSVLQTPPPPDFQLSAGSIPVESDVDCSGSTTVVVTPLNGFNRPVTLSVSVTLGVTASFNPVTTSSSSALTLSSAPCKIHNGSLVTVTGTSGNLVHVIRVPVVLVVPHCGEDLGSGNVRATRCPCLTAKCTNAQ